MRLASSMCWLLLGLLSALPVRAQNITTVAGSSTWNIPVSVRLDAAGNLYTPDYFNHVVYKVNPNGNTTIVAGTYQKGGFAGDGALATSAKLDNPAGAVPAPDGTLYITEYTSHRIRKVAPNGIITTFAGTGTAGFSGDGGPAVSAAIRNPWDILIDASGNILFSDYGNARSARSHRLEPFPPWRDLEPGRIRETESAALQAGIDPARSDWEPVEAITLSPTAEAPTTVAAIACAWWRQTALSPPLPETQPWPIRATAARLPPPVSELRAEWRLIPAEICIFRSMHESDPEGVARRNHHHICRGRGGGFSGDSGPALDARIIWSSRSSGGFGQQPLYCRRRQPSNSKDLRRAGDSQQRTGERRELRVGRRRSGRDRHYLRRQPHHRYGHQSRLGLALADKVVGCPGAGEWDTCSHLRRG